MSELVNDIYISDKEKESFRNNGFIKISKFLTLDTIECLRKFTRENFDESREKLESMFSKIT